MQALLVIVALLFASVSFAEDHMIEGDSFIESDEGQIVLFALPGCDMNGRQGLYGHAEWKSGGSEIICWKYDAVIYIYAPKERTIIFDPSDIQIRGPSEVRAPLYGALSRLRFVPA